jgi:hypothetical protein
MQAAVAAKGKTDLRGPSTALGTPPTQSYQPQHINALLYYPFDSLHALRNPVVVVAVPADSEQKRR